MDSSLADKMPIRSIMTIAILIVAYILFIGFISRWLQAASRPDRQFLHPDPSPPSISLATESVLPPTFDIEPAKVEVEFDS